MSTKKIEEALERLFATARVGQGDLELVGAAQEELTNLRAAIHFIQTVNSAQVTPAVALKAASVNDLFDAIAKEHIQ